MARKFNSTSNDGGIVFGFIILGIGVLLLLKKLGFFFPDWLLTWPMILIVIGTFTLIKNEFKSVIGVLMLGFGLFFLFEREFNFDFGLDRYILPIALIGLGLHLISKKRNEKNVLKNIQDQIQSRSKDLPTEQKDPLTGEPKSLGSISNVAGASFSDQLNVDAILSGVQKRVLSKNFQGGKLTAAFGGIDLDLTQADFNGVVNLQIDVIFGGMKLIVPPHWDIRTEVTNIAAGIEDKRLYRESEVDPNKVLIIRGTILFGGLEIKSF
jgi:predicted membrane protein